MQAFKVELKNGNFYYTRAMYPWHLMDRLDVLSVDAVEESDYVKAACVFYQGIMSPFGLSLEKREEIIRLMANDNHCLWHACYLVCGGVCVCAKCAPNI